jgi:hypothetical protein
MYSYQGNPMKKFAVLTLLPLLASCTEYAAVDTPAVPVNYTTETAKNNVDTTQNVTMRTVFETTQSGKTEKAEISGVPCKIKGTGYRASIVTPAIVKMPLYRGKTDPFTLTCTYKNKTKTQKLRALNETKNAKPTSSGGGIAGILIQAAVVGAMKGLRDPQKDRFSYPFVAVVSFGGEQQ